VGIAACLLEDKNDYEAILDRGDDSTKTALFACARLLRAPLSVEKVAKNLHSKDPLLALAAERYLESEDSPEARRIVLSLHPNEARILGATTAFYPSRREKGIPNQFLMALMSTVNPVFVNPELIYRGHYGSEPFDGIEKRLQDEVKRDPSLLGVYNWNDNFVRVYKDRAVLSWEQDPARYRERNLSKEEFESFKGLLLHYKADELPPFLSCIRERCDTRELLMLGRNGGRRVFVRTSPMPPFFAELDRMFENLRRSPAAIKYWAGKDVPGLQVLFADDRMEAVTVWKNGSDLRLLASDKARRAEIDAEIRSHAENLPDDEVEESEFGEDRRISEETVKRQLDDLAWYDFSGGVLGSVVSQPAQAEYLPEKNDAKSSGDPWKSRAGAVEVRLVNGALQKVSGGRVTTIKTGNYFGPVITPDGRWVVATRADEENGDRLVRIDLRTNREFVLDEHEDRPAYRAIAFVPSMNRILVGPYEREEVYFGENPLADSGEFISPYSLLDPATGSRVPVRGEVRPLAQQTFRPLQPATNAFEFWAAIPKGDGTVVGIYNSRTFSLKPLLTLPKIKFDSMDMWVDQPGGKMYFVYQGHLLSTPIKIGP
jgi:hypothetical protein